MLEAMICLQVWHNLRCYGTMKSRQLKLWKGPLPTWKKQRSPCKSKINFCFHVNFEVCLNFGSYSSPNMISHSTDSHNTNFQDCPKYFPYYSFMQGAGFYAINSSVLCKVFGNFLRITLTCIARFSS